MDNDNSQKPGADDSQYDPLSESMDAAVDESPLGSSGDSETHHKRQRMRTPSPSRHDPPEDDNFMVAASPPKYVSMDEILKAADGVGNMTLAHEIAVDEDFQLKKFTPENSLERKVRDIMHQAFWDGLQERLEEDPPDYTQALALLGEVKESVLDVLLPQHTKLRQHIEEVIDLDLIQQQAEHNTLDVYHYATFIVDIMAKLCAPVRDERVAAIRDLKEVVPLFKEIFSVLDLMKMDMANFTIQQIRPFIQKQSVEYERKKFSDFLKVQEENNLDGLQNVKTWLTRYANKLQYEGGDPSGEPVMPPPSPAAILNLASLELLDWDENVPFPETLMMDLSRLLVLRDRTQQLTLISAILLVTYSTVGGPIAGIASLKNKLKDELLIIMGDKLPSELGDTAYSVSEYVQKEVNSCLKEHGFTELDASKLALLKGQVESVISNDHPVHKLLKSRIMGFVNELLSRTQPVPVKFPPGTSTISEELNVICGQFLRLVSHNRNVFGVHYANIIGGLLKRTQRERSPSLGATSQSLLW